MKTPNERLGARHGKFFNIAGPCFPDEHYMLPATERMPDVMRLIRQEQYFAIH